MEVFGIRGVAIFFNFFFYESFIRCLYCGLFIFALDLLIYN